MEKDTYCWKNKIILVVEDDEVCYRLIEGILFETEAKILWAKDGKEAVELCKLNNNIDIVLMEIKLPVLSGYIATEQIKQIRGELPVIAQTAYVMEIQKEIIMKSGCNDFIAKPYTQESMLGIISKYLN